MRIENQGIALWYGTPDAPAPTGAIEASPEAHGASISITVGVAPQDPSNGVQVRYRLNGGPAVTVTAAFLRADGARQAQYFRVWLPRLQAGDRVDYTPLCRRVGRQVPAPAQAAGYLSSFSVAARQPSVMSGGPPAGVSSPGTGIPVPVLPQPAGSEFEVVLAEVRPLLGEVGLVEVSEDGDHRDVSVLSAGTGRDGLQIAYLVVAHRHAAVTGLPASMFYGLLREGLPGDLSALARYPWDGLCAALRAAAGARIIAEVSGEEISDFVRGLRALEVAQVAAAEGDGAGSPLAAIFRLGIPDRQARERAYASFLDHDGDSERWWRALSGDELLSGQAERLRLALRLGSLTANHVPLVGLLLEMFDSQAVGEVRDLAWLTEADWLGLVARAGGAPVDAPSVVDADAADRDRRYAATIHAIITDAYPTRQIARRLCDDPELAGSAAARFLAANPDFDLRSSAIDPAVAQHPPEGVDAEALRAELAQLQRLVKVAPTYDALRALRDAGIHSAFQVARMGQGSFVRSFAPTLGEHPARLIYERAAQTHAVAAQWIAQHHTFNAVPMAALAAGATPTPAIPDWELLFGSPDYCACTDCRSVTSPAAYLADLLHFLKTRQDANPEAAPVSNVLFARRPDLRWIELSCNNTNLTLPYVDLVNEILERAVAPTAIDFSKPLTAEQRASLQTSGSTDELRAAPQHITGQAYDTLGAAVYPWDLPFDLWGEQVRAWLGHLGVRRDQLMTAFRPPGVTELDIATEYLGMPQRQRMLITGQPPPDKLVPPVSLAECYGLPAATTDVVAPLKPARTFLDATRLAYAELVELLRMRFVNPDSAIGLSSADPEHPDTCDTTKLQLDSLDSAALDRIHRFVRLYRALGFTPRQLDRALAALKPGVLDEEALLGVATARALMDRLGIPLERVLALCTPLDTYDKYSAEDLPLYDELFLSAAVTGIGPGQSPFQLLPDRSELKVIGDLADKTVASALLGALGVTQDELSALVSGPAAVISADSSGRKPLNLANLSALVRAVVLARALKLPIAVLLRLAALSGATLFGAGSARSGTAALGAVRDFIATADSIAASGLSVAAVDAALTATVDPLGGVIPDATAVAATLTALRTALRVIFDQTATVVDDTGEVCRKQLARLGWDSPLVDQAIGTLQGNVTYTTQLAKLPDGVPQVSGGLRYDSGVDSGVLSFTGPMSSATLADLQKLSADQPFGAALQALFAAPRQFVTTRMRAFTLPTVTAPLASLPDGVVFAGDLVGKVFYDPNHKELCSRGYLSPAEHEALKGLSKDAAYGTAVKELIEAQDKQAVDQGNAFLTTDDLKALFDDVLDDAGTALRRPRSAGERFALVLGRLQPHVRRTLATALVRDKLASATGLDVLVADLLLAKWLRRSKTEPPLLLDDFLAPEFVESDPSIAITTTSAPHQLAALTLLHRVALIVKGLRLGPDELQWVFADAQRAGWLNFSDLPATPSAAATPSPLFGAFLRLLDLVRLRDAIPGGAVLLTAVFALAREPTTSPKALLELLASRTGWDRSELELLTGASGLNLTLPADFADERALSRVQTCSLLLARLGVSVQLALSWSAAQMGQDDANSAWQTAKAKYTMADWSALAGPLRDTLRERQRSALVSFLVAHPAQAADKRPAWSNAYELYQYFLVDVEMSPCKLTSRIVLATNSVQLFVQRCLLNLEPDVQIGADAGEAEEWAEWAWMGKYRLWEANRRIFLYPENYLEPDLRPDKSPFFVELEAALRQKDVTDDAVDAAFRAYLEKLDAVARLQPCGIYHQSKLGADGTVQVDVLHVFARTWAAPHLYYYRQFVDEIRWTAWERVDLDIQGDQLMPVIWKGRLFLFWPLFVQAAEEKPITMPPPNGTLQDAKRLWQVQFAWSELKNHKWQSKQLITDALSTGQSLTGPDAIGNFLFLPDAEFVTDGKLSMACYKKLATDDLRYTVGHVTLSSGKAVFLDQFHDPPSAAPTLGAPPANTHHVGLEYVEQPQADGKLKHQLVLPTDRGAPQTQQVLLQKTPGVVPFRILYPNHYASYPILPFMALTQFDSFFFVDGTRAYFVIPNPLPVTRALITTAVPRLDGGRLAHELAAPIASQSPTSAPANPGLAAAATPVASALAKASTLGMTATPAPARPIKFTTFYHPFAEMLIGQLDATGSHGMLAREVQLYPDDFTGPPPPVTPFSFEDTYSPLPATDGSPAMVSFPHPAEQIDFDPCGGYSLYNWELFFHAPLLLAERLSTNQRFEEAQRWFHTIFNPTDRSGNTAPQRYWQTKPFFETTSNTYANQQIESVLEQVAKNEADLKLRNLIHEWRRNPYQPDLIAQIRTTAYQKAVVMKYLDNLIAWADQLFRQGSTESITQATQLYVLAAELLGRRPEEVTPKHAPAPQTYAELEQAHLDEFSNALIAAEHLVPAQPAATGSAPAAATPSVATLLYFCIPRNDKLLRYWDTVADRLFKIRHCLNIEGVAQQVGLLEPPVSPSLLVAATAAGQDIAAALADIDAPLPYYRFATVAAKASEFAAELKALGAALLSTLEKRDAEALARLRSGHELSVLTAARDVRKQQLDEAQASLAALQRSREVTAARQQYYQSRTFMNDGETAHVTLASSAMDKQQAALSIDWTANILGLIPDFKVGCPTTIGATFGGANLVNALRAFSSALSALASLDNSQGALSSTLGGYHRRADDWAFQAAQASKELVQIDQQIAAAQLRIAIAQKELDNQDLQIRNASEADAFMRTKYTNQELYDWMVSQVATLFFQSYQLAYDLCKRAEQAYRSELAQQDTAFIQFGYWDSLYKGLLAGERLAADLKRMEASYLELNRREYELHKRVSLAALDPVALLELQQTGECYVSLPEALFDLDCPANYLRRIKSVDLTIPCVAGPYTSVNCTATLLRSTIRTDPRLLGGKYGRQDNDPRFRDRVGAIQSVVTSTAQQDSGLFELNLRDDRYLPFEGSGVTSDWHLSLPKKFRQFDYNTITDVVLHLRYTAREGGAALAVQATAELQAALNAWVTANGRRGLLQALSARREFPDQWARFLNPTGANDEVLTLPLSKQRFPFLFHKHKITIDHVQLLLILPDRLTPAGTTTYTEAYAHGSPLNVSLTPPAGTAQPQGLAPAPALGGTPTAVFTAKSEVGEETANWTITAKRADVATLAADLKTADNTLAPDAAQDLFVVLHYSLS